MKNLLLLFISSLLFSQVNEQLLDAIQKKDLKAIEQGLEKGAKINGIGPSKIPLIQAVKAQSYPIVKLLLEKGANVNQRNSRGSTALIFAVYLKQTDLLALLLEYQADLNIESANGYKAFDYAVDSGNLEIQEKLIFAWVKQLYPKMENHAFLQSIKNSDTKRLKKILSEHHIPKSVQSFGLILSVITNNKTMMKSLTKLGVSVNIHNESGYTALPLSARMGRLEIVKFLVEKLGAKVGIGNDGNDEASPFIQAARGGQTEVGQYLISKGVDVNKQNGRGYTALTACMWYQRKKFAELILKNAGNPEIRAQDHFNSIDYAYFMGFDAGMDEIIKYYLRKASQKDQDKKLMDSYFLESKLKQMPSQASSDFASILLSYASFKSDLETVKKLLTFGVDLNQKNSSAFYPLTLAAAWNKNADVVNYLLKNKANPNIRNKNRYRSTPLMEASRIGNPAIAKSLYSSGAMINTVDKFNDSALNWAVFWQNYDYINFLLKNKAKTHFVGRDSKDNALDIAIRKGGSKIITLLKSYGAKSNRKTNLDSLNQAIFNKNEAQAIQAIQKGVIVNGDTPDRNPLILSIYNQMPNVALKLIKEGAALNLRNSDDVYPLMATAIMKDSLVFTELFKRNVDPFAITKKFYNSFDYSLFTSDKENIKRFFYSYLKKSKQPKDIATIQNDIKRKRISTRNHFVHEMLYLGLLENDSSYFATLLKRYSFKGEKSSYTSLNFLSISLMLNLDKMIDLFLKRGFNLLKKDKRKRIVLDYLDYKSNYYKKVIWGMIQQTAQSPAEKKFLKSFQKKRFDQNTYGKLSETLKKLLFFYAISDSKKKLIRSFLESSFDINQKAINGNFFLSLAARQGKAELVKLFLSFKANVQHINTNSYRTTALMEAASNGSVEIGNELLKAGADIDQVDINNDPALNYAVFYGNYDFVKLLLEHGANYKLKGQSGYTPLMTAKANKYTKIVQLLEKKGARE